MNASLDQRMAVSQEAVRESCEESSKPDRTEAWNPSERTRDITMKSAL